MKKSYAFSLVDIIFAVLFVSIFSLVGLKLYLESSSISKNTDKLTIASLSASNFVESLYKSEIENSEGIVYLDAEGLDTDQDKAYLMMEYIITEEMDTLKKATVKVKDINSKKKILEFDTKIYRGEIKEND